MADLTITINPPTTNTITITDGVLPHNSSHSPAGSDSLASWYATVGDLSYVSGQIGAPAGVVLVTGNQDISGVKNFYSRPTVNGSGVMLSGEIAGTGYLTGYVQVSQTGSFVTSGNTGNFVTSTQTGQLTGVFYPYTGNPAAYVQGAVVRPSNTGNFVDTNSIQTISGQKNFTKTISAPTGFFGISNTTGNFNGQTIAGGVSNTVSNDYASVLGGFGNFSAGNSSFIGGGSENNTNGSSATIGGGNANSIQDSEFSSVLGGQGNQILNSAYALNGGGIGNVIESSEYSSILGGAGNTISGGLRNAVIGDAHQVLESKSCFAAGFNNLINQSTGVFIFGSGNSAIGANNSIVLSSTPTSSSGRNTAVISYDSGIYLNGPTFFSNRPTHNGTGFLLSGEASTPSTGYLTGYVNKSETGDLYPRSNPSGYITGVDLSSYALSANTGAFLTTGAADSRYVSQSSTGLFVPYNGATGTVNLGTQSLITHSVKSDSSDGLILASNNGTTGIVVGAGGSANATVYGALKLDYTTADKVPVFDSLKNLVASNVATGELNYLTGVTSSIQTQFGAITNSTGSFLTTGAADLRYVGLTGDQNVSGVKNFVSRPTVGGTGVMLSGESSPVTLQAAYDNSSTTEILTDSTRGAVSIKRGSAADTDAVFEVVNNTGVSTFLTKGNGETTLTLNSAAGVIATGLILANTTPATVGNQCLSPRFVLSSHGWKTTATAGSQRFDWGIHSLPIQGTSSPDGTLVFGTSVNSGAYVDAMHLYTEGAVKYRGIAFPGSFSLSTSTAQTTMMYMAGNALSMIWSSTTKQNMNNAGDYSTSSAGTYGWSDLKLARDGANTLAQVNGTGAQTFRVYGTTTASKYLSLAHNGTDAVISASSGNVTITTPTSLSSSLTANGAFISTPQSLSGAGAVNVTTLITKITSTGLLDALTLADGVDGQMKIITNVVDGGSAILTPTTKTGFTTITFTNAGDSATLVFYTTVGWTIQSLYMAVAA